MRLRLGGGGGGIFGRAIFFFVGGGLVSEFYGISSGFILQV